MDSVRSEIFASTSGTREAPAPPALTLPCYCQWGRLALVHLVGVAGRTPGEGNTLDATEAGDALNLQSAVVRARKPERTRCNGHIALGKRNHSFVPYE